jgi:outer membrane protein TolC
MLAAVPAVLQAQTARTLTLDDAIQLAVGGSEEIEVARAGVERAEGNQRIAESQFWPQLNASLAYSRTLQSQYSALSSSSSSTSSQGSSDSSGSGLNSLVKNLPFGQKNQWTLALTLSQTLFAGGRLVAQQVAADARRRSADIDVTSANAQLVLNVAQSYFDAQLADELVTIADSTLAETEETFRQTDLAYRNGAKSEFEMLRARVARDNQLPVVLQRRNDRQLAYDRLKQYLNVPLEDSLVLTTGVQDPLARFHDVSDTSVSARAPVRQAEENVRASEAQIDIASAERWPNVSLNSRYAPVAYPENVFPSFDDFRTDWTVGVSVSVPLFTGGRIGGNEEVARGTLDEARARLRQTKEAAALDARSAFNDLNQSVATLNAVVSTVEQAQRAHDIAQVRFREGLSTQLELSDARLQMQEALANHARALRNVQVARVKLALMRDLPLGVGSGAGVASAAVQATASMGASQSQSAAQGNAAEAVTGAAQSQGAQP